MKWAVKGERVVCEVAFEFPNPIWEGRKVTMRPGRLAEIVDVVESETGHPLFQVGWFDFGNGRREGYVEHTADGLAHYWKPYMVKTPIAQREPRPMVVSRHPYSDPHAVRGLPHIGYWAASRDPLKDPYEARNVLLPWPEDFIDPEWRGHEKNLVIAHLRNAPDIAHCKGFSTCRICGAMCGSSDKSDGSYVWPAGLSHYVEEHSLRPPPSFLMHVIRYAAKKAP